MRVFAALLLYAVAALAQLPRLDPAAIERVVTEELRATNTPGVAVAVVAANRVLFVRGYGVASVESTAPVTPDMLFRMGSTTKMFTAAAVATLAIDRKIDMHAPVGRYIQGLDPTIAALTAHQLLSHTAGLKDEAPMFGSQDEAALGDGIRKWKPDAFFTQPGKIYSYSNPGYWLAGYLAETVAGKSYADVVEERVFKPVGMSRSTFRPTMAMTRPLAQGHDVTDGKAAVIRPAANNASGWPAGSMFSNVQDLGRFVLAFLDGGKYDGKPVLPAELIPMLTTRRAEIPGSASGYGYGLNVSRDRGVSFIQHGGSRAGYGSSIIMVPDQNFGVIVLANRTGSSMPKTSAMLIEMFLDLEAKKTVTNELRALTAADLERYAGTYANGAQRISLRADAGALVGGPGNRQTRFTQAGKDFLAAEDPGQRLIGVPGAAGKVEYLHAGGRSFRRVD